MLDAAPALFWPMGAEDILLAPALSFSAVAAKPAHAVAVAKNAARAIIFSDMNKASANLRMKRLAQRTASGLTKNVQAERQNLQARPGRSVGAG